MTDMQDYKEWTKGHLKKNATMIPSTKLFKVETEGLILLEKKRHILSYREAKAIEKHSNQKLCQHPNY